MGQIFKELLMNKLIFLMIVVSLRINAGELDESLVRQFSARAESKSAELQAVLKSIHYSQIYSTFDEKITEVSSMITQTDQPLKQAKYAYELLNLLSWRVCSAYQSQDHNLIIN